MLMRSQDGLSSLDFYIHETGTDQTQVHSGTGKNELCDRVLETGDIGIQLLKSRFRHRVLQQGYILLKSVCSARDSG